MRHFLLLSFTLILAFSNTLQAEVARASGDDSDWNIYFTDRETYLNNVSIDWDLKCYERYGTGAGKTFYKRFFMQSYQIAGLPKVYGTNRYVTGRYKYTGRVGRTAARGTVSFTGQLTGSNPYVKVFAKLTYGPYTCYNLAKFRENG
jgi:hypothetical protein